MLNYHQLQQRQRKTTFIGRIKSMFESIDNFIDKLSFKSIIIVFVTVLALNAFIFIQYPRIDQHDNDRTLQMRGQLITGQLIPEMSQEQASKLPEGLPLFPASFPTTPNHLHPPGLSQAEKKRHWQRQKRRAQHPSEQLQLLVLASEATFHTNPKLDEQITKFIGLAYICDEMVDFDQLNWSIHKRKKFRANLRHRASQILRYLNDESGESERIPEETLDEIITNLEKVQKLQFTLSPRTDAVTGKRYFSGRFDSMDELPDFILPPYEHLQEASAQ